MIWFVNCNGVDTRWQ